nr:DDE-type integrase/transposase/recombinase [Candidatus Sigynarchaeota archaeon]
MELIEKSRIYFLTPNITLKQAYRKLQECCLENGVNSPPHSYLEWYIYQHTTRSEFCQKEGNKYQKSRFTPSLASFQGASMPMQVLQIDSTSYDVFPVDENERETICTPSMIAAIDCYTRMISEFSVSFFSSSSQSVLEVLVQSILPKTVYTEKFETEFDWPIEGFPVVLLTDNGMDYQSSNVREFCLKNDIILEHAPIRTPRYKAVVEQWFNVLHKALVQENVEGIRPSLRARLRNPELKPEAEAIFTLQEIESWLHKWIVDEYHYSNQYDDHVLAPRLRFKKAVEGNDSIIFPAPREPPRNSKEVDMLHLAAVDSFSRVLGSHGIIWEHLC